MAEKHGFYEELYLQNTAYPNNHRIYPIAPNEYVNALTNHLSKKVGDTLTKLAEKEQYEEMLQLVMNLEKKLQTGNLSDSACKEKDLQIDSIHNIFPYDLARPLSSIHYRYGDDEKHIPLIYPELFFSVPHLVTNQNNRGQNFFNILRTELITADSVSFMVSFIRWSGLQLLLSSFDELRRKGKQINILTSTYMNITEPKALRRLLEIENVQVKIFDSGHTSFHTKAYLFTRNSQLNSVIIGSSNLSHSAIQKGYEWNVKLPDVPHIPIYKNASQLFLELWNDQRAIDITPERIDEYERKRNQRKVERIDSFKPVVTRVAETKSGYIDKNNETALTPNSMQKSALDALKETRERGNKKGIVIAATGTGKTYLSAFDAVQMGAKTVLFLAHRDELLENAKKTFAAVLGSEEQIGKVTGQEKEWDKPYLFSTVQTLHREDSLKRFNRAYFDYIVVDEFHHAEAETYRKIIDYFTPVFLLGVTATPERMDGRDVLALCDNNVVYEIRLHQALEAGLLSPFHYFGLGDTVDYDKVVLQNGQFDEGALIKALKTNERVDYILEMIEKFGYDGRKRRALGFCATVEHARYMADQFTMRGYCARCLTGEDDPVVRREMLESLESSIDPLEFIFTVNIFNEGIDIPSLNLVLFLRPTESATVFIQQLGRGLRKSKEKEFVTILDFIGNNQRSFIVPLALSGQKNHKAFDRDALRVIVETDFAQLPDGCFVELEEISRQKILDKINLIRMNDHQMLTGLYKEFQQELGYSPEIEDFLYSAVAPSLHYFIQKYGSWVETKKKMKDTNSFDQDLLTHPMVLEMVKRLEQALPIKWPYEFAVLSLITTLHKITSADVIKFLTDKFGINMKEEYHKAHILRAMERLASSYKKQKWAFGNFINNEFVCTVDVKNIWKDEKWKAYLKARIEYGITEFRRTYNTSAFLNGEQKVQLYQNYTRNDLIYLFQAKAKEDSWREGIYRVDNHYIFFVTLKKDVKNTAEHLQYLDYFMDKNHFHWQSANQNSHRTNRGQDYVNHRERDIHIHLFVRKFKEMHGKTLPFTYLGELDYVSSVGDNPMNITWKLHNALPDDLYLDLVR
ncbi:DUF3427 domain-containing protein [Brevibacillus laterosporus]|uniref:DUF3427 domain-containing protein n=1 Tax=Brevibacillus halotolerans TaxID=1507437 RepID=A0ABT4HY66_9BACL|nr:MULTISPECIES: DUF3427 domain-containing protein [Brevibacillus]MCR8985795.1 DUF3427 domain-containing protein [Brevibacillus laterosporus]MCZ0831528.1 DUF3427 domain-containing protein [Brevibacillus halotolerans]